MCSWLCWCICLRCCRFCLLGAHLDFGSAICSRKLTPSDTTTSTRLQGGFGWFWNKLNADRLKMIVLKISRKSGRLYCIASPICRSVHTKTWQKHYCCPPNWWNLGITGTKATLTDILKRSSFWDAVGVAFHWHVSTTSILPSTGGKANLFISKPRIWTGEAWSFHRNEGMILPPQGIKRCIHKVQKDGQMTIPWFQKQRLNFEDGPITARHVKTLQGRSPVWSVTQLSQPRALWRGQWSRWWTACAWSFFQPVKKPISNSTAA